jgi:hypothetical protein
MSKYPEALYSEILPNLFQGGTEDDDVIHYAQNSNARRTDLPFDSVITMYAWARPADWNVQEFRYGVPDASISRIDLGRLRQAVEFGYIQWKSGDRVLVRCQAGLNRSGLVTALILIKDGHSPEDAINLIRNNRGEDALFNESFVNWLITSAADFISPPSAQSA